MFGYRTWKAAYAFKGKTPEGSQASGQGSMTLTFGDKVTFPVPEETWDAAQGKARDVFLDGNAITLENFLLLAMTPIVPKST